MTKLRLEYVPLSQALQWDWIENPKQHDIGGIIQSIGEHGFRDPPELDATLGAFAQGNGRVKALAMMADEGGWAPRPKYIGVDLETSEWAVPVLFGGDSDSVAAAMAYAIDANNLVVTGGDTELWDLLALYDRQQLAEITAALGEAGQELVTMDGQCMDIAAQDGDKSELARWSFQVHYEAPIELLEELEELIGPYFMPRSKRVMMPEFFAAMVRRYCGEEQPVVVIDE